MKAEVNGEAIAFKDGGIRENNPSAAAMSEFHALYYNKVDCPAVLLSVGTGRPDPSKDGFARTWLGPLDRVPLVSKFLESRAVIRNLLVRYTEGEKLHHQMREHAHGKSSDSLLVCNRSSLTTTGEHLYYKRLNVSHGLESMPLDDWRKGDWHDQKDMNGGATLTAMEEVTSKYLERSFDAEVDSYAPPAVMLRQTAEKLVRQRRARERLGGPRWDTFVGKGLSRMPAATNSATRVTD